DPHRRGALQPRRHRRQARRQHAVLPALARPPARGRAAAAEMGIPRGRGRADRRPRAAARHREAPGAAGARARAAHGGSLMAANEGARERVRRFINARSTREIIFVRGTTEGINLVAQAWARPRLRPGDEILISALEHHANIVPWQLVCEQTGCTLKVAPINARGELELEEFLELLGPRTRPVGVAHVSNALGTVLPVKRVIEAAHEVGA